MADPSKASSAGDLHDGRFGKRFDDEVSVKSVLWTTVMLAVFCILGMWITWEMRSFYNARAEAASPPPSPIPEANEPRMPQGPLLQRDPEGELEAMRHEMSERLNGYGWVDEGTGVVHIPVDQAIDLLVAQDASHSESAATEGGVGEAGE